MRVGVIVVMPLMIMRVAGMAALDLRDDQFGEMDKRLRGWRLRLEHHDRLS